MNINLYLTINYIIIILIEPCTTGSSTGTRKEKPENYSDSQDYVSIGGPSNSGYPYPYPVPYPYQPTYQYPPGGVVLVPGAGNPYRSPYPFDPQYPVDAVQPTYYGPYYAPPPPPPLPYVPVPYQPPAYSGVPPQQPLYEQSSIVDAYRSPLQQSTEQSQFFRQPAATSLPYYFNTPQQQPPQYFRAHAYNRPLLTGAPAFLQQRDASSATGISSSTVASVEQQQQYDLQQPGSTSFDGNQFNF